MVQYRWETLTNIFYNLYIHIRSRNIYIYKIIKMYKSCHILSSSWIILALATRFCCNSLTLARSTDSRPKIIAEKTPFHGPFAPWNTNRNDVISLLVCSIFICICYVHSNKVTWTGQLDSIGDLGLVARSSGGSPKYSPNQPEPTRTN